MYLKVIYVVLFGLVVKDVDARPKDKFHIKIQVPEFINHHHHTKLVLLEDDKKPESFKKPSGVEFDFGTSSPYSSVPYEDGYRKSWKSLRTEKYETQTVDNPHADNPANRYIKKEKYKVKEKLPYIDTPIEYDHEYEYPVSGGDYEYNKKEKLIDFNNEKTDPFGKEYEGAKFTVDPFPSDPFVAPKKSQKQKTKKKPKNYSYKYPVSDYEYDRNVEAVEAYFKKSPEKSKKSNDFGYNEVGYESNYEKEKNSNFDRVGPSEDESYNSYKNDGPTFSYL